MDTLLALAILALPQAARETPIPEWKPFNAGVRWEPSLEAALRRAAELRRPVLFHQLVGDLDKEGC